MDNEIRVNVRSEADLSPIQKEIENLKNSLLSLSQIISGAIPPITKGPKIQTTGVDLTKLRTPEVGTSEQITREQID